VSLDKWRHIPTILDALEDLELPLLAWGVTQSALSYDEVMQILMTAVDEDLSSGLTDGPDEKLYLAELKKRALLHQVPGSSPVQFRTRLAEGLRLLASLRQTFPPGKSAPPAWWRGGAPLIADYRLQVSPRRYPRRDIEPVEVLAKLSARQPWTDLQQSFALAMLDGRDLARFQVVAAVAVLEGLSDRRGRGVVVGAGTGSGKTLAFYLPAFLSLGPRLMKPPSSTHTVALYPRKELLRDQAREAMAASRLLESARKAHGARPLRIGLLYADTPHNARDPRLGGAGSPWRRTNAGVKCPYFPCSQDGCTGDLIWLEDDRATGVERLVCASCNASLPVDAVALTRESMVTSPPDVLFTTTEMLSRYSSDARLGSLLGWTGASSPELVLLDEVHTYSGVHGAQVGLTLRRWRNCLRVRGAKAPVFVGLSATLRDAVPFFASLTGLAESTIEYVTPASEDLLPSGRQYSLVLRGDPLSGTSLLSTSLQTSMLMGRLLDPAGKEGLFGSSGFIFTDDLDVTNRFYDDLRDAEGGQTRFRPGVARRAVLAQLRSPNFVAGGGGAARTMERYRDGQSWDIVEEIGHQLSGTLNEGALRIGRTSSQDAGVDNGANLIVATASLEVGFNDPRVGLVIQHKAPRDSAAFLQRKGRAGRSPHMRPWTVVVLSDYGRDRAVYQGYEQLLDPEISARRLPIRNRYVLKIQAAQALLDWLSRRAARGGTWIDARSVLRTPKTPGTKHPKGPAVLNALRGLLTEASLQDELGRHLEFALGIGPNDVQAVMWEEPRSLLLSVVPTAMRRLSADWTAVDTDPGFRPGELLPEHLTRALFEPLNVPDVVLELPFDSETGEDPRMPLMPALREAVPGRVSRRFGVDRDEHRTWLPLPAGDTHELATFVARGHRLGPWSAGGKDFEVVRPLALRLEQPDIEIADSSNARPVWGSQFVLMEPLVAPAPLPHLSPWSELVGSVRFALHVTGDPLEVRRFTTGSVGETRRKDGTSVQTEISYAVDGTPAAMGFSLDVDALIVEVSSFDRHDPAVLAHLASSGWRSRAFAVRVAEDPALDGIANSFQRTWLSLVYLTAYSVTAATSPPGTDIASTLAGGRWLADLPRMLNVLYRAADPDDPAQGGPDKLVQRLQELGANVAVAVVVESHAALLGLSDITDLTWDLAERAFADTWAAAVRLAVLRTIPDAEDSDLIVDVLQPGPSVRVAVSETSIGGLGLIEDLRLAYSNDPHQFWKFVSAAVRPSEYEEMDRTLRGLLHLLTSEPDGPAATAAAGVRSAKGAVDADAALKDLLRAWSELDGPPRHLAVSAFSSRFLRPGADASTDRAALELLSAWDELEHRVGAEVDARVVAYAAARGVLPGVTASSSMTADQVFSLLWPRGLAARNHHLESWQPYREGILIDRLLLACVVQRPVPEIDVVASDWPSKYREALSVTEEVDLVAPLSRRDLVSAAVRRVAAIPVDRGALRVYGHLGRFELTDQVMKVRISVAEAYQ
jgi:ATP-dependent helicase Lhr and Lhr-like helicase